MYVTPSINMSEKVKKLKKKAELQPTKPQAALENRRTNSFKIKSVKQINDT